MDNQQRVSRRRRNLPAELKVEIVDCFPVENAVHFLANVPNRLIIHHCALRVRRILKMIGQIASDYARTMPAPDSDDDIWLENGHQYSAEMDIFLRYGGALCRRFIICRGTIDGFVGFPVDFFDDLIKHYYQTKIAANAIRYMIIYLPSTNPAQWPAALVQPRAEEINMEEVEVDNVRKRVHYILRNKHNPGIEFKLRIDFDGDAKCYQQMTCFRMKMADA